MARTIQLLRDGLPERPSVDTAVSRALLIQASGGKAPETFRLHVPGRVLAFGKRDTLEPRYHQAAAIAQRSGFVPIERLAGGRAAVFHEGTLAFSWTIPTSDPRPGITARFEMLATLMVRAFERLGVASRVGEVPGEYCPGEFSVNHDGRVKLMGVGQRLARSAAHIGGVVVVGDADLARRALIPVYAALGLAWIPDTVGSLQMVSPSVTLDATATAIEAELATLGEVEPAELHPETLQLSERLAPEHESPLG
jgi:lipoate-protein ligase A